MRHKPVPINKELFEEFQRKEKEHTIKLYKITTFICIIINIIFMIFFLIYNKEIYTLKYEIKSANSTLLHIKDKNLQTERKANQKLVNIFANVGVNKHLILDSFKNVNEFNTVLSWTNLKKENLFLCFKSDYDHEDPFLFRRYCDSNVFLILITAENGRRFGGFISDVIATDLNTIQYANENAFLFSLDKLKKYKVRNKDKAFYLQPNGFFSFGEDDLVVNVGFKEGKRNKANFPSNYGNSGDSLEELTGGLKEFDIIEMEIIQTGK